MAAGVVPVEAAGVGPVVEQQIHPVVVLAAEPEAELVKAEPVLVAMVVLVVAVEVRPEGGDVVVLVARLPLLVEVAVQRVAILRLLPD